MTDLYKVTGLNGEPLHGGSGRWPRPTKGKRDEWRPGRWRKITGQLVMCANALHLTEMPDDWLPGKGVPFVVWLAQGRGTNRRDNSRTFQKTAFYEARLLRPILVVDEAAITKARNRKRGWPLTVGEWEAMLMIEDVPGGRLVFGQHRLPESMRACRAWPPAGAFKRQMFARTIRRSRTMLGIPAALDRLVIKGVPGAVQLMARQ